MLKLLCISLISFLLFSCNSNNQDTPDTTVETLEDVEIKYAENFTLKKTEKGYRLELLNPNTKKIDQTVDIEPEKNKKIISLTATLNGMLAILEAQDVLVGISDKSHIFDPKIKSMIRSGKVKEYGPQYQNSTEKIIASKATIIFYDIVDEKYENQEKLKKFGIEVMPIYDWRENHPLAKAEWIKVVGAITGKMKEANAFFDEVEANYNRLSEVGGTFSKRPGVFCGHLWGDTWHTPGGGNYFSKMITDAGGDYRYKDSKGTKSLAFTIEQIIKDNKETRYWLNPGKSTKEEILRGNPHAKHLDAFDNSIYCYSKRTNKYWEQSAARPDLVLSDLIHIFHPEEKSITKFHFYQNIQ